VNFLFVCLQHQIIDQYQWFLLLLHKSNAGKRQIYCYNIKASSMTIGLLLDTHNHRHSHHHHRRRHHHHHHHHQISSFFFPIAFTFSSKALDVIGEFTA